MNQIGDEPLRTVIDNFLNGYVEAKKETFAGHPFGTFVRNEIPNVLYNTNLINPKEYLITGSVGQGNWAMIPWICIFERSITTSATKGVYIVYLLSKDGKSLYLSFNQGCTDIRNSHSKKETIRIMHENATRIRAKINSKGFYSDGIFLGDSLTELGELYQEGMIFYKEYKRGAVPPEEELQNDLRNMMQIYKDYVCDVENNAWWPSQEEYTPGISKEQWLELLQDDVVFTKSSLEVMAAMYASGGQSSCVALAEKYGDTSDMYRMTSVHLAERVVKKTGCKIIQNEENSKWWPVLYLGRNTKKEERGNYVWKLRPELYEALKEFDILRYLVKRGVEQLSIKEILKHINNYIASKGYTFDEGLIANFYLSLKAKPFVILAGISGTGKSKLVRLFAEACGATTENGQFKLLPVKPDWSDASDLLGYVDLERNFKAGEVLSFIYEASKPENANKPYFLCLDEMNLARVEYYFSDFLSVIETRKMDNDGKIVTDPIISKNFCEPDRNAVTKYAGLTIPENVYVIGTVNMDETTFPFSRKVLDRANTIEFSSVNLIPIFAEPRMISLEPISNSVLKSEYLQLPREKELQPQVITFCEELQRFNQIMEGCNAQVAYRVRDEAVAYLAVNQREKLIDENAAMDNIIMQKLLPRLQGSSGALKRALCEMFIHCADKYEGSDDVLRSDVAEQMHKVLASGNKYPCSAKKIYDMIRRFEEDGFTSFWS